MATAIRNRNKALPSQSYSEEFRKQVVAQIRTGKYTRSQIADAHGLSMGSLRGWEKKYGGEGAILPTAPPLPNKARTMAKGNGAKSANGAKDANGAALQVIDHAITALQKTRTLVAQFEVLQTQAQQILAHQ